MEDYLKDRAAHPEDRTFFTTKDGLRAMIDRKGHGAYCGYIEVPTTFKGDIESLTVHGGITGTWDDMIGFDCLHHKDFYPGCMNREATYWTFEMVKAELEQLSTQLSSRS